MHKTMILGAGGQLGSELCTLFPNSVDIFHENSKDKFKVDLRKSKEIELLIKEHSPDILINSAAIANVDLCEKDHTLAYQVNGLALKEITRICNEMSVRLVHISTDYVFDGSAGWYSETSIPAPINYYGLSKLVGDLFVQCSPDNIIIRTSGVFGHHKNFPLFVLNQLKEQKGVNAIKGFYSPIHARKLAEAIKILIEKDFKGIINIAGDRISRYELAQRIAKLFSLDDSLINEVPDIPNMNAKRPFDSSLDITFAKELIRSDFYSTDTNLLEIRKK